MLIDLVRISAALGFLTLVFWLRHRFIVFRGTQAELLSELWRRLDS
jgi:hypothetical protein